MNLLIISTKAHKSRLTPLIQMWKEEGHLVRFSYYEGKDIPKKEAIVKAAKKADAVMMLTPANRAASTLIDRPVLHINDRKVPISLVPVPDEAALDLFVKTTVEVHQRSSGNRSVSLLAQRFPRYLTVTDKIFRELKNDEKIVAYKWTSDVIQPGDMLYGINQGAGVCLYMGHGRPSGWVGYYGIRAHHIAQLRHKPSAAILSLCCWTAGRKNVRYSFCESLMLNGITSSVFGAIRPTLFADNTRWAVNLSAALKQGAATIGELIVKAWPANEKAGIYYRLFGDPTTPLLADEQFIATSDKISTYE